MTLELDLNGQRYSVGKLAAMQQFHVSRRIAPILPSLLVVCTGMATGKRAPQDGAADMARLLQPLADGIATLKDEDAEYVIGACLAVVQRKQDHGWAQVWNASRRVAMFQDMDLGIMLTLVVRVVVESLGSFTQGLLTSPASGPDTAQQTG